MINPTVLMLAAALGANPVMPGSANDECRVRVTPAGAGEEWTEAARALDAQLKRSSANDRDCREIIINAVPNRMTVAVLTIDGRRAVRSLHGASDLASTVEGLIVTVPADARVAGQEAVGDAATMDSPARLLLSAAGGGRLSFPGTLAGAVIDMTAGVVWPRYELALFGLWSPGLPSNWNVTPSSLEVGATVGRRQSTSVGDAVIGLRGGLIRTAGVWSDEAQMADGQVLPAHVLPSLGAYTAFVTSSPSSSVHFRPQVSFQWLPTAAAYSRVAVGATLPSWSLTLSLGGESGIL